MTLDVMLVDGRAVVREGLRVVIEQEPDLVVVANAATVAKRIFFMVSTPDGPDRCRPNLAGPSGIDTGLGCLGMLYEGFVSKAERLTARYRSCGKV